MQSEPSPKARHLVIGDLQGCRVEFERLLERLDFDSARDQLLLLGDLVNRGPDSAGCVRLARQLGAQAVLGNHDLHALALAVGRRKQRPGDTLDGLLQASDRSELLAYLACQPLVRLLPGAVLVHAALPVSANLTELPELWVRERAQDCLSETQLEQRLQNLEQGAPLATLTRGRFLDREGRAPAPDWQPSGPIWPHGPGTGGQRFEPWFWRFDPARWGGRRAVFGHWAALGLVREAQALGLDTGCVWGGALTAWIAEEDRLVSVPAERAYADARSG